MPRPTLPLATLIIKLLIGYIILHRPGSRVFKTFREKFQLIIIPCSSQSMPLYFRALYKVVSFIAEVRGSCIQLSFGLWCFFWPQISPWEPWTVVLVVTCLRSVSRFVFASVE
jgi:hypothetical protein